MILGQQGITIHKIDPTPRSLIEAFEKADRDMGPNEVARRLREDWHATGKIFETLQNKLGIRRLVNLTSSFQEARIALAFYAGDGIVVKVIPEDYLSISKVIYHLPSIVSHRVHTETRSYVIKSYPWLDNGISQAEIEKMRYLIKEVGLRFTQGDDHPGNLRRLPDKKRTIVGIDSLMYQGDSVDQNIQDAWHNYIHALFPIYNQAAIPRQTNDTNFSFVSIHDPNSGLDHFDHNLAQPIQTTSKPSATRSFWPSFLSRLSLTRA